MTRSAALLALALALTPALAQAPLAAPSVTVPREKITLDCADAYFRATRQDFLLVDETYPTCTLRLPLALRERWPGRRTFDLIPRVSATLYARDDKGKGRWLPLTALVNPGPDPLHRAVTSASYRAVELTGKVGRLSDAAGTLTPTMVSAGGKLTVCASPLRPGESPCTTFDITARYKVYLRSGV